MVGLEWQLARTCVPQLAVVQEPGAVDVKGFECILHSHRDGSVRSIGPPLCPRCGLGTLLDVAIGGVRRRRLRDRSAEWIAGHARRHTDRVRRHTCSSRSRSAVCMARRSSSRPSMPEKSGPGRSGKGVPANMVPIVVAKAAGGAARRGMAVGERVGLLG